MQDQLISLIAEELSVDKATITLDSDIQKDLGADSLDAIQLIMSIENTFGITVPESEIDHLKRVADLLQYIKDHQ
ncbi:MAG: acyl carrier protein [Candidatus Neomarinimicrobiota bacterium]|jgi:acyl carrier protein|nr:acyl carrier protein [Candidatus Neomarinimicrobiota bacterium]MDX9781108.1 acyl carrier protein [bacterium]